MPRDKAEGDSGPSLVLFAYGLFIMLVGAVAFNEAEISDAALSAIFVGNGGAVFAFGCAAAVREHGVVKKGDDGWREYMLGIHFGLLVPVLYSALSVWRAVVAAKDPEKGFIVKFMVLNVIAGVVTLGMLLRYRGQAGKGGVVIKDNVNIMAKAIKAAEEKAAVAGGGKKGGGKEGKKKAKAT